MFASRGFVVVLAYSLCLVRIAGRTRHSHGRDDLPGWLGEVGRAHSVKVHDFVLEAQLRLKAQSGQNATSGTSKNWTVDKQTGTVTEDPPVLRGNVAPFLNKPIALNGDQGMHYVHMATIAKSPFNDSLVAAWQAAPEAEGQPGQRIMVSFSHDGNADNWWPAQTPTVSADALPRWSGAQWGPVLHADAALQELWLFFSESQGDCLRPRVNTSLPRWVVGGDIRVIRLRGNRTADWTEPQLLYPQSAGRIPKITANGVVVLQNGDWLLPFWRQRPRPIDLVNSTTNATRETCVAKKPTSAGVLIRDMRDGEWRGVGSLATYTCLHPPTRKPWSAKDTLTPEQLECGAAGWLIENTVAELEDGRLMMLFRTRAGFVYKSFSADGGHLWSTPSILFGIPNPDAKVAARGLSSSEHLRGLIALAFNDHQRPLKPPKDESQLEIATRERRDLTIALSKDGDRWLRVAKVFSGEDARLTRSGESITQLHYPAILDLPDGQMLVAYTKSTLIESNDTEDGGSVGTGHEIWMARFDMQRLSDVYNNLSAIEVCATPSLR